MKLTANKVYELVEYGVIGVTRINMEDSLIDITVSNIKDDNFGITLEGDIIVKNALVCYSFPYSKGINIKGERFFATDNYTLIDGRCISGHPNDLVEGKLVITLTSTIYVATN